MTDPDPRDADRVSVTIAQAVVTEKRRMTLSFDKYTQATGNLAHPCRRMKVPTLHKSELTRLYFSPKHRIDRLARCRRVRNVWQNDSDMKLNVDP